jgi:peptidoglycan/LPS O-acetylase OafA/YrhL
MSRSGTDHLAYLDGWRGIAIIVVLVAHFQFGSAMWIGNFGVQLFFVLSGYLMGGLLFVKQVSLKDFFVRRITRIFPTFLVFVMVMVVYAAFLQPRPYVVPLEEILATLLFMRTYFPAEVSIDAGTWPIGHMWSLNVEEHSYMLLGAGALLVRSLRMKNAKLVFLWLSVLSVLFISLYYPTHQPDGATPWHRRSEAAALGLLASAAYRVTILNFPGRWFSRSAPLLPLLALGMAIVCYWIYARQGMFAHPSLKYTLVPLLLAYSINHLAHVPNLVRGALSSRILCWFGTCSFSLYLWQQPFYYAHEAFGMPLAPALLGALACGSLSFYLLENPLRLYLNQKWKSRTTKTVATTDPIAS